MADENTSADRKTEEHGGKAKEALGKAAGNEELAQQGRNDQATSNLKQGWRQARGGLPPQVVEPR